MNPLKIVRSLFTSAPRLTPADCTSRIRSGDAVVIDVREPDEWTFGVAQGAALLPLSDLTGGRSRWEPFLEANAGKELLIYCASGSRSGIAARLLVGEGHRAANAGGLADWKRSGWPVEKPAKAGSCGCGSG